MQKLKKTILELVEEYGNAVDCQGWEIPFRHRTVKKLYKLLEAEKQQILDRVDNVLDNYVIEIPTPIGKTRLVINKEIFKRLLKNEENQSQHRKTN